MQQQTNKNGCMAPALTLLIILLALALCFAGCKTTECSYVKHNYAGYR